MKSFTSDNSAVCTIQFCDYLTIHKIFKYLPSFVWDSRRFKLLDPRQCYARAWQSRLCWLWLSSLLKSPVTGRQNAVWFKVSNTGKMLFPQEWVDWQEACLHVHRRPHTDFHTIPGKISIFDPVFETTGRHWHNTERVTCQSFTKTGLMWLLLYWLVAEKSRKTVEGLNKVCVNSLLDRRGSSAENDCCTRVLRAAPGKVSK